MTSIRSFLIIVLLCTIVVVNSAAVFFGYRNSMEEADKLFDQRLADIANVLATTPTGYYETATGNSALAFQIWQGERLEASSRNAPAGVITNGEPGFSDVRFDGFGWRAYTLVQEDSDRKIIVAESTDIRFALADNIVLASVLPMVAGLPIIALLIWLAVGRGLQPVRLLAHEIRVKQPNDLSPVTDLESPKELKVLISSFNDLLHRLDNAIQRERGFAADAAHELRTPVSVLKLQLHNLRNEAGDNPKLLELQQAVDRMGQSIEQVLLLYRMTPEQFSARLEDVDLTALARETIAELYSLLSNKQQNIELTGDNVSIKGDAVALQTLLTNLIDNASRYGGDGGNIRVSLEQSGNESMLTVEDNGPGIPADQRDKVFQRFYRGQHDSSIAGTGIGLAIVRNIAEIHNAQVSLGDSSFATGLAICITFSNANTTKEEAEA